MAGGNVQLFSHKITTVTGSLLPIAFCIVMSVQIVKFSCGVLSLIDGFSAWLLKWLPQDISGNTCTVTTLKLSATKKLCAFPTEGN